MDLPALLRRPLLDRRIRPLQPFGDRLGILLVRLPHGPLRREAPPPQVLAHGPDRQPEADLSVDQLPNRLAGPERRGDPQPLRGLGLDRLPDASLLPPVEDATGADRSSGAIPG
jgi:hypothetical protein